MGSDLERAYRYPPRLPLEVSCDSGSLLKAQLPSLPLESYPNETGAHRIERGIGSEKGRYIELHRHGFLLRSFRRLLQRCNADGFLSFPSVPSLENPSHPERLYRPEGRQDLQYSLSPIGICSEIILERLHRQSFKRGSVPRFLFSSCILMVSVY